MARRRQSQEARLWEIWRGVFEGAGGPYPGAIYERVSSLPQTKGRSLIIQGEDAHPWAEAHNITLVDAYIERGKSGTTDRRPEFQRLLRDCEAGKLRVVVVWKYDRFARNTFLQLQTVLQFIEIGVLLVSVTEYMNYLTADGWSNLIERAKSAEYYSKLLGERMQRVLKDKADQGKHNGPVMTGMQRNAEGILIPGEGLPAIIHAFERYRTRRYSFEDLARELNAHGYRTRDGSRFTRETVRTLLKNKTYCGYIQYHGEWRKGTHEAVISEALFHEVQAIMEERTTRPFTPVRSENPGWLRGIAYCEDCRDEEAGIERRLWPQRSGRNNTYRYYICAGHRDQFCPQGKIPAATLEEPLLHYLLQLQFPDEFYPLLVEEAHSIAGTLPPPTRSAPRAEEIERKKAEILNLWRASVLSYEECERELKRLQSLQAHAAEAAPESLLLINEGHLRALLRDIPNLIREATPEERHALAEELFDRVWVKNRQLNALTPRAHMYPLLASVNRLLSSGGYMGWLMGNHVALPIQHTYLPIWASLRQPYQWARL